MNDCLQGNLSLVTSAATKENVFERAANHQAGHTVGPVSFHDFDPLPILPPCPDGFERMGDDGRISIFKQPFGSEGTIENSPALKCRDRLGKSRVPQGRLKNPSSPRLRRSKRFFRRPCGTGWDTVKPRRSNAGLFFRPRRDPFGTQRFGCTKIEMRPGMTFGSV